MEESQQAFMSDIDHHCTSCTFCNEKVLIQDKPQRRPWTRVNTVLFFFLALSFGINTWLYSRYDRAAYCEKRGQKSCLGPYSPADQAMQYHLESVHTHNPGAFAGPPSDDFDRAWSDLLVPTSLRVTADELRHAGKKSIKLKNDEGYLGYIEVYHQLHCVKRMVQIRWSDHYPELADNGNFSDEHFHHCIEVLRKGIMCSGDTSLNTFEWSLEDPTKRVGISDSPRKCVNWNSLDSWARTRAIGSHYELVSADEIGAVGP